MSGALSLEVMVDVGAFADADAAELERAVRHTLRAQGVRQAEVSVALLGDDAIRDLNLRYLAQDRPTDVIAFALGPGPGILGDVYLGVEEARRQAAEASVSLAEELVRLAVHGTLHVLGHEHPAGAEREASPMFALQETLVREILGRSGAD